MTMFGVVYINYIYETLYILLLLFFPQDNVAHGINLMTLMTIMPKDLISIFKKNTFIRVNIHVCIMLYWNAVELRVLLVAVVKTLSNLKYIRHNK